jgi:hypothetical protein
MNNLYTIVISNPGELSIEEILGKLGILKKIAIKDFYDAQHIVNEIGIAKYEDKIIIVEHNKVHDFFFEEVGVLEQRLCSIFPESTISAFWSYSVPDIYGFSIIKESKRIRTFYAIGDDKPLTNFGERLPIETVNEHLGLQSLVELMLYELFGGEKVLYDVFLNIYEYKFQ